MHRIVVSILSSTRKFLTIWKCPLTAVLLFLFDLWLVPILTQVFLHFLQSSQNSLSIKVFENHRKSLIQHCERSELRLHFEWTKVFKQYEVSTKQCFYIFSAKIQSHRFAKLGYRKLDLRTWQISSVQFFMPLMFLLEFLATISAVDNFCKIQGLWYGVNSIIKAYVKSSKSRGAAHEHGTASFL